MSKISSPTLPLEKVRLDSLEVVFFTCLFVCLFVCLVVFFFRVFMLYFFFGSSGFYSFNFILDIFWNSIHLTYAPSSVSINTVQGKDHRIETYEINKISLSCSDYKIYTQSNGYDGLAFGFYNELYKNRYLVRKAFLSSYNNLKKKISLVITIFLSSYNGVGLISVYLILSLIRTVF